MGVNVAGLAGVVLQDKAEKLPELYGRKDLYMSQIQTLRDSGQADTVKIVFSEKMIDTSDRSAEVEVLNLSPKDFISAGERIIVFGKVQTMRNRDNQQIDTCILCDNIFLGYAAPQNDCMFSGQIKREACRRRTPKGRTIADFIVNVTSEFDRNFNCRVPVIAWEQRAEQAAELKQGDHVTIRGRLQSRLHDKADENGELSLRVVYEISASEIIKEA